MIDGTTLVWPSISADGRYVVFESFASNLVANDTNRDLDVFVRDLQAGTTMRASVGSSGTQANARSVGASMSADGTSVAFYSAATNLVENDTNNAYDVFVHELRDSSAPLVLDNSDSLEPDREATVVPRSTNVSATFSEEMNSNSIKAGSRQGQGSNQLAEVPC